MPKKQKILIVIADQLRADCVEGALAAHVDLPNIQAFRQEAVTFTKHFTVTCPCGPSRASIFTGRYAMNHGSLRNGTPMAFDTPNIARTLRKSGYDPLLFGYTDTSPDPSAYHPNDPMLTSEESVMPGFREIVEMQLMKSYPWRAHLKSKGYDLPEYLDFFKQVSPDPDRPAALNDPTIYRAEDSDTAFLTDELLKHLSVKTDESWAAFATFIRPHPPLAAPEPYNKMYDPAKLPLPNRMPVDKESAVHPFFEAAQNAPKMQNVVLGYEGNIDPENDEHVSQLRATYLGLATEVDAHFGRIIAFLKQTNQYDDTIVIFTADHGEMLGDHHIWGKQTPYDQAFRIPLIIHDPRNPAQYGKNSDAMTETVDLMPTLLDLVGQAIPAGVDGRSLRPFLAGQTPQNWREHVFMELDFSEPNQTTAWQQATGTDTDDSNFAILREARLKLVHFNGGLQPLLFDLEKDPFEMNNLAADPAHMPDLLRLAQKLLNHRMRHTARTLSGVRITKDGAWGAAG